MIILGIETSCDETSVGIVENGTKLIALSTLSSLKLHRQTGGIIPEIAAREQVKVMIPALEQALNTIQSNGTVIPTKVEGSAQVTQVRKIPRSAGWRTRNDMLAKLKSIDAIAVTVGPGLIGSLLVGVETARTLAFLLNKPLIPVNHLIGHIYACFLPLSTPPTPTTREEVNHEPQFPLIAVVVSGGHTDLLYFESHDIYRWLGGTLDDAAGECLDKVGRLLGYPYPAGPAIDQDAARIGHTDNYHLPRPLINANNYNFSFSGLKTAAALKIEKNPEILKEKSRFVSSLQEAIIDVLISKIKKAKKEFNCETVVVGGGVSANSRLRERSKREVTGNVLFPLPHLSGDNGAMIAAAAFFQNFSIPWQEVQANPVLYFD